MQALPRQGTAQPKDAQTLGLAGFGSQEGEAATSLFHRIRNWFRRRPAAQTSGQLASPPRSARRRGQFDHVIILDGTMCSLAPDQLSNAGIAYHLLSEPLPRVRRRIYYEPGLQWQGWRHLPTLAEGKGIHLQIRRAYGWLACHYRPGDRIFLLGYSRGAYAVRSLAGVIERVGLLRHDCATERNLRQIWRHYRDGPQEPAALSFSRRHCHAEPRIQMVGVWDTVKALGLRLPLLWMLRPADYAFHDHNLGDLVQHAYQALALDENRVAFEPVLWNAPEAWQGRLEQVWFRGAHSDIGGQVASHRAARPLANIPLTWMLTRAEACGLTLPPGWESRFPQDATAPMAGSWEGWGKFFLLRQKRIVGADPSENIHPSALPSQAKRQGLWQGWGQKPAKPRGQAVASDHGS